MRRGLTPVTLFPACNTGLNKTIWEQAEYHDTLRQKFNMKTVLSRYPCLYQAGKKHPQQFRIY